MFGAETVELSSEWANVWIAGAALAVSVAAVLVSIWVSTRQLRKNGGSHVADLPSKIDELVVHVAVIASKLDSVDSRCQRLERQVDDVIIPKQERIVRTITDDD